MAELLGLLLSEEFFFDDDQRIRLHRVSRAVSKSDARITIRPGLDLIAFVEGGAEVLLRPIERN